MLFFVATTVSLSQKAPAPLAASCPVAARRRLRDPLTAR